MVVYNLVVTIDTINMISRAFGANLRGGDRASGWSTNRIGR